MAGTIRPWVLGVGLLPLVGSGLVHGRTASWWDARWDRRCALTIPANASAVRDLPVVVRGSQLKRLANGEPVSVASLRVIGPQGEVPCQFDEFDGTGHVASRPNHTLDDDDELVFQVDLPAAGAATYWLYWNTTPLPPGRYPSRTLIGDAMEPGAWQHDVQLWNDQAMVGMRGPARGQDPTKNQIDNWGAGALVLLEVYRVPVLRIQSGWSSILPRGAFGARPSTEAAGWSLPRRLVQGPVRVAAACEQRGAERKLKGRALGKIDVEHRVWLYERGAYVCFEEIITARDPAKPMDLRYECGIGFGDEVGEQVWYSEAGEARTFSPTADQIAEAKRGKIVLNKHNLDPWMAGYSPKLKKGYAILLDTGEAGSDEKRNVSCYARTNTVLRYRRSIKTVAAGQTVRQRLWVVGLRGEMDGQVSLATWKALRSPSIRFGPVGKRGAP